MNIVNLAKYFNAFSYICDIKNYILVYKTNVGFHPKFLMYVSRILTNDICKRRKLLNLQYPRCGAKKYLNECNFCNVDVLRIRKLLFVLTVFQLICRWATNWHFLSLCHLSLLMSFYVLQNILVHSCIHKLS